MTTNRKLVFAALIALLLTACDFAKSSDSHNNTAQDRQETQTSLSDADLKAERDRLIQRVKDIYSVAESAYRSTADMGPDVDIDKEFCSRDWITLRDKVTDQERRTGILCLDGDYWVMGQDVNNFFADNFKFLRFDGTNANKAYVTLDVHNFGEVTPVQLTLVKEGEDGDWKIHNFVHRKFNIDFRKAMEDFLNPNHP